MAAIVRATLLLFCLALPASAQLKSLALYIEPATSLNSAALRKAESELQRIFAPIGIEPIWKSFAERKSRESFQYLVVASFDGACATDRPDRRVQGPASLGDSSVSRGRVLPFFRINCGLLMKMIARATGKMSPAERDAAVGVAVARVMAHEIYHILAQTTTHRERGVAKAAFSATDLVAHRLDFDEWSIVRMRPAPVFPPVATALGQ